MFIDLVSNYDITVHRIALLSMQQANTPKEPIMCTFTTLQNMEHSVRTSFGESDTTYVGDKWALPLKRPTQGLGQGNGAAPEIWSIARTPILKCL